MNKRRHHPRKTKMGRPVPYFKLSDDLPLGSDQTLNSSNIGSGCVRMPILQMGEGYACAESAGPVNPSPETRPIIEPIMPLSGDYGHGDVISAKLQEAHERLEHLYVDDGNTPLLTQINEGAGYEAFLGR